MPFWSSRIWFALLPNSLLLRLNRADPNQQVWDFGDKTICRGIIATPLDLVPFEVDLERKTPSKAQSAHSTDKCKTNLPTGPHTNPITGLVIHPIGLDIASPPMTPLYTAVRLSATATNQDWWETNLPPQLTPAGHVVPPRWVTEIENKIHTRMTIAMASRIAGDDLDGDGGGEHDDDDENQDGAGRKGFLDSDSDSDEDDAEEGDDAHADFDPWAEEGPEVFPWRIRLWGLALSPGGGSSAVLATPQFATRPGRADWAAHRSQVLFESRRRGQHARRARAQPQPPPQPDPDVMNIDPQLSGGGVVVVVEEEEEEYTMNVEALTVEARLWEWMYGGGPGVPGLTPPPGDAPATTVITTVTSSSNPRRAAQLARDAEAQARRDRIASFFRPLLRDNQLCIVCADGKTTLTPLPLVPKQNAITTNSGDDDKGKEKEKEREEETDGAPRRHVDCECPFGHQFAICGVSGLPIMQVGVSRSCGTCHARCMRADVLADRWLEPAGLRAEAEVVRRESAVDVCPRCGGKHLD